MDKHDLLDLLGKTKTQTLQYFNFSEEDLALSYGPGKWTIRQILHHLTDTEYLFIGRLKKIIAEPKQVVWAFDQDIWNSAFGYAQATLDGKRELYSISRDHNCAIINEYYDLSDREFVHSETGLRTLKMEFEKVALHNESHNRQIEMALSLKK
jgi:hypothetical protein